MSQQEVLSLNIMINKLRRLNRADNPFEAWELYIDGERYAYHTHPTDDASYRGFTLTASTELVRAIEDEDGTYLTVTRWRLKGIHLPMNSNDMEKLVLRVLLLGEKSVKQELNGCI